MRMETSEAMAEKIRIRPVGAVSSGLNARAEAPRQGLESEHEAWLVISEEFGEALRGIRVGHELIVVTWLHLAEREQLLVHPRGDQSRPLTGVFFTRSPDRPNPIGLHRVKVLEAAGCRLKVSPLEALDGTPILDIKKALPGTYDG